MSVLDLPPLTVAPSRRVTRADINLGNIYHNVRVVRSLLEPNTALLAVIKADGYGHGSTQVAYTALAAGAGWLGVACVDEGLALRGAGIDAPVLVMGHAAPAELHAAMYNKLTLTLGTTEQCAAFVAAARHSGCQMEVHLKVDTGMGRYGLLPEALSGLAQILRGTPEITVTGCFTHLARGEEDPRLATNAQLERFASALAILRRNGIEPNFIHAANSGATLVAAHAHLNLVRAGLLLYGYRPDPAVRQDLPLRPAMELTSCLVRVESLPSGTHLGYGHTHRLERSSRIGLVPIGYADGLLRALSNMGYMVVGGRRVPIVGRISMDSCMVDLSGVPGAREGDPVVVIGQQGEAAVWADDLANWAGTIVYEILCGIGPRVPRYYLATETP